MCVGPKHLRRDFFLAVARYVEHTSREGARGGAALGSQASAELSGSRNDPMSDGGSREKEEGVLATYPVDQLADIATKHLSSTAVSAAAAGVNGMAAVSSAHGTGVVGEDAGKFGAGSNSSVRGLNPEGDRGDDGASSPELRRRAQRREASVGGGGGGGSGCGDGADDMDMDLDGNHSSSEVEKGGKEVDGDEEEEVVREVDADVDTDETSDGIGY